MPPPPFTGRLCPKLWSTLPHSDTLAENNKNTVAFPYFSCSLGFECCGHCSFTDNFSKLLNKKVSLINLQGGLLALYHRL